MRQTDGNVAELVKCRLIGLVNGAYADMVAAVDCAPPPPQRWDFPFSYFVLFEGKMEPSAISVQEFCLSAIGAVWFEHGLLQGLLTTMGC